MVDFDIAPVKSSIIMCAGVGGGGGNAVKHMYNLGMTDVTFMLCNTDRQALEDSPIPIKVRLGDKLTGGLGAGNKPERGREAAEESVDEIREIFVENDTRMLFITAGMGGGTGTGAAPVIARIAKEMGILTVAIVSIPFKTEGARRIRQAIDGIEEISKHVDSLLVIDNESINEIYGDLTLSEAFGKADDILATAAKSISDIITSHFQINVDFEDVKTVMQNSGVALMGSAQGSGENRAIEVGAQAMSSPLLHHKDISGAKNVLLNITSGSKEVTLSEAYDIIQYIQECAGNNLTTDVIWGAGRDEALGDDIRVTVVATGFNIDSIPALKAQYRGTLRVYDGVPNDNSGRQIVDLNEPEKDVRSVKPVSDDDFAVVIREEEEYQSDFNASASRKRAAFTINMNPSTSRRRGLSEEEPKDSKPIQEPTKEQHSTPDSVTPKSNIEMESGPLLQGMSEDALSIPAWKRRGIQLDPISTAGGKVKHETLESDPSSHDAANTLDLFDSE